MKAISMVVRLLAVGRLYYYTIGSKSQTTIVSSNLTIMTLSVTPCVSQMVITLSHNHLCNQDATVCSQVTVDYASGDFNGRPFFVGQCTHVSASL